MDNRDTHKRHTDRRKAFDPSVDKWENMGHLVMDKLDSFEGLFERMAGSLDKISENVTTKFNEYDVKLARIDQKMIMIGVIGITFFGGAVTLIYNLIEAALATKLGIAG